MLRKPIDNKIWKNRKLWAAIFLIVFLTLFKPPIMDTIGQRFRCVYYVITDLQSFQRNLTTPHAGEQVLPSAAQEMLALLRSHQVVSYNLSGKIVNHILLHQRIVEAAWPRRMSPESHHKLILISELDHTSDCKEVERGKEVALVFCH